MRHVKLFEEFNEEGNHPINDTSASKMYIYYVNNKDPKKFHADVRDPDGKIVFEVNAAHLSNDGFMKGPDDIQGLAKMLISKNKIKAGDSVVPSNSAAKAVAGQNEDFIPAVNTNMNQDLLKKTNEPE